MGSLLNEKAEMNVLLEEAGVDQPPTSDRAEIYLIRGSIH